MKNINKLFAGLGSDRIVKNYMTSAFKMPPSLRPRGQHFSSVTMQTSQSANNIFLSLLFLPIQQSSKRSNFCRRGSTKFVTKPTHLKSVYMHPNSARIKIHPNPTMGTSLFRPSKIQDCRHFGSAVYQLELMVHCSICKFSTKAVDKSNR